MSYWTPISEFPKNSYTKEFLLSIEVNGIEKVIKGELSAIVDRDSEGNLLDTGHDAFMTFYEPIVGIGYTHPYNFKREIPLKYIKAWMPVPEPYKADV